MSTLDIQIKRSGLKVTDSYSALIKQIVKPNWLLNFTTLVNLYDKTRHSYIYMFPIAGQTAGPIGLKFFVDTHGWPGGVIG